MTDTTQTEPNEPQHTDAPETESDLIARAQFAVSQCNWVVGECASRWTQRYAKGRTDADFGQLVGLSGDQIYQRRRVWETFGDVRVDYSSLKWSHFYISLNWDDAPECLQWAEENQATVAELKMWRRTLHGEEALDDSPPDPWGGDGSMSFLPSQPVAVRDVDEGSAPWEGERTMPVRGDSPEREPSETAYAPFRNNAGSAPDSETAQRATATEDRNTEQLIKRVTTTLERVNKALSDDVVDELNELPQSLRDRFFTAVEDLKDKVAR